MTGHRNSVFSSLGTALTAVVHCQTSKSQRHINHRANGDSSSDFLTCGGPFHNAGEDPDNKKF